MARKLAKRADLRKYVRTRSSRCRGPSVGAVYGNGFDQESGRCRPPCLVLGITAEPAGEPKPILKNFEGPRRSPLLDRLERTVALHRHVTPPAVASAAAVLGNARLPRLGAPPGGGSTQRLRPSRPAALRLVGTADGRASNAASRPLSRYGHKR